MNEDENKDRRTDDDEPEGAAVEDPIDPLAEVLHVVAEQARNHPFRTLGAAFGIGYVLGGGMPSFAMRMLGIVVMRSAANMVSWETIAQSAWGMARSEHGPNGRDRAPPSRREKGR